MFLSIAWLNLDMRICRDCLWVCRASRLVWNWSGTDFPIIFNQTIHARLSWRGLKFSITFFSLRHLLWRPFFFLIQSQYFYSGILRVQLKDSRLSWSPNRAQFGVCPAVNLHRLDHVPEPPHPRIWPRCIKDSWQFRMPPLGEALHHRLFLSLSIPRVKYTAMSSLAHL